MKIKLKLKPSDKIVLQSFLLAGLVVLVVMAILPDANWLLYAGVGALSVGGAYSSLLQDSANKKRVDEGHD